MYAEVTDPWWLLPSPRGWLCVLLGSLVSCSVPAEPERAPPAALDLEPAPATGECAPAAGLSSFACARQSRCARERADGEPIDLFALLCAADALDGTELEVENILAALPVSFRANMTLKHGRHQGRLRGHPIERPESSTSADLDHPRVMMWDHSTGLTISFNGGLTRQTHGERAQTGANRLAFLAHDKDSEEFSLWAINLPVKRSERDGRWNLQPTQPAADEDCKICHGPRSRPVWAMYPDWPGFYGSDNDEVTGPSAHQAFERDFLGYLRHCTVGGRDSTFCHEMKKRSDDLANTGARPLVVGAGGRDPRRRYTHIFSQAKADLLGDIFERLDRAAIRAYLARRMSGDARRGPLHRLTTAARAALEGGDDELRDWLGLSLHAAYPYRPSNAVSLPEASRAFLHRPNSRVGILYNRLNARNIMAHIRSTPIYSQFRRLYAFWFMDCGWPANEDEAAARVLAGFERAARVTLEQIDGRILYPALLTTLGLKLRDVDIRFAYPNPLFDRFDRPGEARIEAETIMDLGYISYARVDNNKLSGASHYFNSYFDGSATFDELVVAMILADIAGEDGSYTALYELGSMSSKYGQVISRYALDEAFLTQVDSFGRWFPLPYPARLAPEHHRQSFLHALGDQHQAVCARLASDLARQFSP